MIEVELYPVWSFKNSKSFSGLSREGYNASRDSNAILVCSSLRRFRPLASMCCCSSKMSPSSGISRMQVCQYWLWKEILLIMISNKTVELIAKKAGPVRGERHTKLRNDDLIKNVLT